jgi:hypothetical protein
MSSRMSDVLNELQRLGAVTAPPAVKFLPPEPDQSEPEAASSSSEDTAEVGGDAAAFMGTFQTPFEEASEPAEDEDEDAADDGSAEGDAEDSDESEPVAVERDPVAVLKEALERIAMLEAGIADLRDLLSGLLAEDD